MPVPKGWIKQPSLPCVPILLYHRIRAAEADPFFLSVSPENFRQHLEVLARSYNVITQDDLACALAAKRLPERSILITIDDGYNDLLWTVLPCLRAFGMKATAFVCGDGVQPQRDFWWDVLETIVLRAKSLPERLHLKIQGEDQQFDLAALAPCDAAMPTKTRAWSAWDSEQSDPKVKLFLKLSELMPRLVPAEQKLMLDELQSWSGQPVAEDNSQLLSEEELKTLSRSGTFTIGGHSARHPMLSMLPTNEQKLEVLENRNYLESVTGQAITSFAYPYGAPGEFSVDTVRIVQECNFNLAFAAHPEVVWPGTAPFSLPRLLVRDCTGLEFQAWLEQWS